MYFTIAVGLVILLVLLRYMRKTPSKKLPDVPGLTSNPLMKIFDRPDPLKIHLYFHDLFKEHGKFMKMPYFGSDMIFTSDYDAIYQVCVKEGKKFGGRGQTFRAEILSCKTGIVQNTEPDATWKTLRMTTQRHLRQFGDGLSRLENIIIDIAGDMFEDFEGHVEQPYDPRQVIFDTALNSIAFLMVGRRTRTGDMIVEQMREYERLFLIVFSTQMKYVLLDAFPWLRHLGWPAWRDFQRVLQLEADIWKGANDYADNNPGTESICQVLRDHIAEGNPNLTETDAIKATLSLLLAGVTTTSNTFYGAINILAHNQDIQEKLHAEIEKIQEDNGREPNLQDRSSMPYTRACLLEILRETSVVAFGVAHKSVVEGEIKGFKIPADIMVVMILWSLHHDEDFWEDPYRFNPERFLDDQGDLLPADHPNRKHMMAFGAGPRVCLGESLAMARLFLWLVTLVRKFKVTPAEGNEKSSADSRNAAFEGILRPSPYKVVFKARN